MGGKIDAYVDCSSPYSYLAVIYLRRQRRLLEQYGIDVDKTSKLTVDKTLSSRLHPFFLGGVNQATGNKPPSTLPAKAAYGPYDLQRACEFYGTPRLSAPSFFPILSLLPQRCMLVVKHAYPRERFESVYERLWVRVFHDHVDISKVEEMVKLLGQLNFDEDEVTKIVEGAGRKEIKDDLNANTKTALEKGAFGAPWFWLKNDKGEEQPMFGSDRWSYMFRFLGVDVREMEIVDKQDTKGAKL